LLTTTHVPRSRGHSPGLVLVDYSRVPLLAN